MEYTIIWKHTKNKGETFDDDENFSGHKTITTIKLTPVTLKQIKIVLNHIHEIAADYGDGVTCGEVLAVFNNETKESLPIDEDYWGGNEDEIRN